MRHAAFGNIGIELPIIGQGTWYLEGASNAVASLRAGIELGLSHIDTAEMYGSGRAEAVVGKAIQGHRDSVYVVSKVLPGNASRAGTVAACERSLRQLDTDHLDLYLLHWPGSYPLQETFTAMDDLVAAGKIRAYGVSNFDVDDLDELERSVDIGTIACNQVFYSAVERTVENDVLPWCRQRGIPIVAYSPFGHGRLPGPDDAAGRILHEIADKYQVSPYQIALGFITRHPDVFTIPKAAQVAHVKDNAAAGNLLLDAHDLAQLETRLPGTRPGTPLPTL